MIRLMGTEQLQQSLVFFQQFRLAGGGRQRTGELDCGNGIVKTGSLRIGHGQRSHTDVCFVAR